MQCRCECVPQTGIFKNVLENVFGIFLCRVQSLLLLTYIVRNGSERVVSSTREHVHDLCQLEHYTCYDDYGRDQGLNGMCILMAGKTAGTYLMPVHC